MSVWKQYGLPVTVLLIICIVVGSLLAVVNQFTAPLIAINEEKANNETYFTALPEADAFTALACDIDGVTAVLQADNGAGYVITAESNGYGGEVPAAVSFDTEGNIIRVVMMSNDETPGLGQKVTEPSFAEQFAGIPAQELTLDEIDTITGATISSRAAMNAINLAIEAYQEITGEVS